MHLLWGIVCVELFTEPWNFESVEFAFRNGDFWLRNASFVCQQLSFLYTCMCVCWQHSRVVTLLLLLITCKFHRMSHAQHRNLKAFKWFASQPWLAMWRDVTSFSSSHARTIKASHAATQFLLVVVAKVARSLSLLSLSRFLLSLFAALRSFITLSLAWERASKMFALYQKPSLSLARAVNIAWPVQKRNFELESLECSHCERKKGSLSLLFLLIRIYRKENTQNWVCFFLSLMLFCLFCTLLILAHSKEFYNLDFSLYSLIYVQTKI